MRFVDVKAESVIHHIRVLSLSSQYLRWAYDKEVQAIKLSS